MEEVRKGRGTFLHSSPFALAKGLRTIPAINSIRYQYRKNGGLSLSQAYHATCNHQATDPRGKLYAMLRLLPLEDQTNALLQPDYNFSMKEVYKKLVNYTISKYRNLDILSYAGIGDS